MLSICKVPLGGEDYYLRTAGSEGSGLVEAAGQWLGLGAGQLGLSGQADAEAVRRLLAGTHPAGIAPLMARPDRRRVAAYDCTFSTPKSVSILHALHPDPQVRKEVRQAHERAVGTIVEYLEGAVAAVAVPTADGRRVVRGGEMAAVGFLHRLSRAGDPHLHTHVLVANLVRDQSGDPDRGRPLDARHLFHEARTACALFETHLRHELTRRLGVEWQPLHGWWADLKGVDGAVIGEFSQRRQQILEAVTADGLQGPAARRLMAEATRPPKDLSRPYEEVVARCWERAFRVGFSEARVVAVCGRVTGTPAPEPSWAGDALRRAGRLSVDGSFTEHDLIRATCATARPGRSVADVLKDAAELAVGDGVIARGERVLALKGTAGPLPLGRSATQYVTRETADAEDRLLAMAAARGDAVGFVGYEPHERFDALDSLSLAAASWRAEGREVIAVAPGRFAAAGFEAATGIETIVRAGMPAADGTPDRSRPELLATAARAGSVVVLAEVQCYGPAALEEIVQACAARDAGVVLFGRQRAAEHRPLLREVASVAAMQVPFQPTVTHGRSVSADSSAAFPAPAHRFGGVDVTIVPSLGAARDEAVRRLMCGPPATALVAGDQALVSAIRAVPGVAPADVVHASSLTDALAARAAGTAGAATHVVVLGGAAVLRKGATAAAGVERSHILVAPGVAAVTVDGLCWAAEAARPAYLNKVLGAPGSTPDERRAWRRGAALVETHRRTFGIDDRRCAFGLDPGTSEQARDRAGIQQALQMDRSGLGRRIDERSLGLGR